MDDLISREAAIEAIKTYCKGCDNYNGVRCRACNFNDAMIAVDSVSAVDAVQVVRCKDCVYACERPPFPTTSKLKSDCWCAINDHLMSLDDFCSRGETAAMKDSRDAAEQDAYEQLCNLGNPEDGSL